MDSSRLLKQLEIINNFLILTFLVIFPQVNIDLIVLENGGVLKVLAQMIIENLIDEELITENDLKLWVESTQFHFLNFK